MPQEIVLPGERLPPVYQSLPVATGNTIPSDASHLVVLCDGLGDWVMGEVIARSCLSEERIAVLARREAIRAARPEECSSLKVAVARSPKNPVVEEQLAQARQEILRLEAENSQLRSDLGHAQFAADHRYGALKAAYERDMAHKDRELNSLKAKLPAEPDRGKGK